MKSSGQVPTGKALALGLSSKARSSGSVEKPGDPGSQHSKGGVFSSHILLLLPGS